MKTKICFFAFICFFALSACEPDDDSPHHSRCGVSDSGLPLDAYSRITLGIYSECSIWYSSWYSCCFENEFQIKGFF